MAFNVYANTVKGRKVSADSRYDFSDANIVPGGVAELARLQMPDYTDIKP